jgi:hypothetical protein
LFPGPWRDGLKPLDVLQPEGPSFTVEGNLVKWQKWQLRVSFNFRRVAPGFAGGEVVRQPGRRSAAAAGVVLLGWGGAALLQLAWHMLRHFSPS